MKQTLLTRLSGLLVLDLASITVRNKFVFTVNPSTWGTLLLQQQTAEDKQGQKSQVSAQSCPHPTPFWKPHMTAVPVASELYVLVARGSGDQTETDRSQTKTHPLRHFLRCALCTDGLTFSFRVEEEEVDEEKIIPKMLSSLRG